jgi:hypothetical protein
MHDKKKCAKCIYRGAKAGSTLGIYCNYCGVVGKTCLRIIDGKKRTSEAKDHALYTKEGQQ